MDRESAARLFKTARRLISWPLVCGWIAWLIVLPTLVTHFVLWKIERGLDLRIRRKPMFVLFPGRVQLDGASIDWQGRMRARPRSLKLEYSIPALIQSRFLFSLEGKDVMVEFAPLLRQSIGMNEVMFQRISGKFDLPPYQPLEVIFLDAESEKIEFHLKGKPVSKK